MYPVCAMAEYITSSGMDKGELHGYKIEQKLGEGAFGEVLLGSRDGRKYAIKKVSKKQVIKVNKLHEPFIEKEILYRLNDLCKDHPYFVRIEDTESDEDHIYLVLEYCSGGTLEQIALHESLDPETIRKIAIKIVLVLEKLHSFQIVHRDLKPSNFLLTEQGFVKLADFGTAFALESFFDAPIAMKLRAIKEMSQQKETEEKEKEKAAESIEELQHRRSTFVGTACYMAPELLAQDVCGKEADIWALGCILYEMIFKKSPFFDSSEGMVWKKILNDDIEIEVSESHKANQQVHLLIDLIRKILVKDHDKRLGFGPEGYEALKRHDYFAGVDWGAEAKAPIDFVVGYVEHKKMAEAPKPAGEKVVLSGLVGKKAFFGNFKERMMILYSTPRLVYFDPESGEKKGEIALEKGTPIVQEGKLISITNEKKTYVFKSKTAAEWVEMMKHAVLSAYY